MPDGQSLLARVSLLAGRPGAANLQVHIAAERTQQREGHGHHEQDAPEEPRDQVALPSANWPAPPCTSGRPWRSKRQQHATATAPRRPVEIPASAGRVPETSVKTQRPTNAGSIAIEPDSWRSTIAAPTAHYNFRLSTGVEVVQHHVNRPRRSPKRTARSGNVQRAQRRWAARRSRSHDRWSRSPAPARWRPGRYA